MVKWFRKYNNMNIKLHQTYPGLIGNDQNIPFYEKPRPTFSTMNFIVWYRASGNVLCSYSIFWALQVYMFSFCSSAQGTNAMQVKWREKYCTTGLRRPLLLYLDKITRSLFLGCANVYRHTFPSLRILPRTGAPVSLRPEHQSKAGTDPPLLWAMTIS